MPQGKERNPQGTDGDLSTSEAVKHQHAQDIPYQEQAASAAAESDREREKTRRSFRGQWRRR
jgi:hypothetical protein